MRRNGLRAMQNDQIDKGGLKISVVSSNRNRPIANARIETLIQETRRGL